MESIANSFAEPVALFVQDGNGDGIEANGRIRIIDTGPPFGKRLARMTLGVWRMGRAVHSLRPQLVHFHDPELIPLGLILKCLGYRVVYDVHEDVPRDVLTKYWLPVMARRPVSWVVSGIEWLVARMFDAIISATPKIAERFPLGKTVLVQNFPILSEFVASENVPYEERPAHFAYVGAITRERGICDMVDALEYLNRKDVRLQLAGKFQPASLQKEIEASEGWRQVEFSGWADWTKVSKILNRVRAGLVVLHPDANYLDSYPTKMFEYMSVGLPVIASNFPLWRRIVDNAACGLLVEPLKSKAIAEAMQWILDNPAEAEAMGRRGRDAAEKYYHWETEAEKLVALYKKLLSGRK